MNKRSQQGLVMIAMLLIVFMAGTSMFFVVMSQKSGDIAKEIEHNQELSKIKETLLVFAASYPDILASRNDGPGRLPCPDRGFNRRANNRCDNAIHLLARLPRYINLDSGSQFRFSDYYDDGSVNGAYPDPEVQDDHDHQFWLAISQDYRARTSAIVNSNVNSDPVCANNNLLSLDGDCVYVALIFAPGEELSSIDQDRSSNTSEANWNFRDVDHYLEDDNQTVTDLTFISRFTADPENFNDQVIGITRSELMTQITPRVIQDIKAQLDNDFAGNGDSYPLDQGDFDTDMAAGGLIASWFADDEWDNVTNYSFINANSSTISFTDCDIVYSFNHNGTESIVTRAPNFC